jgi:hypothetical protein
MIVPNGSTMPSAAHRTIQAGGPYLDAQELANEIGSRQINYINGSPCQIRSRDRGFCGDQDLWFAMGA